MLKSTQFARNFRALWSLDYASKEQGVQLRKLQEDYNPMAAGRETAGKTANSRCRPIVECGVTGNRFKHRVSGQIGAAIGTRITR